MKKILLQLDTDKHPSAFDRIVAYDSGADEVLSYGGVVAADVYSLVQSAFFPRGVPDLKNLAVWIGGSDVVLGEALLAEAQRAFFGPFKVSLMLDSNGSNTTAATAVAKLAKQGDLNGQRAVVAGLGAVGLRTAMLLARAGCQVTSTSIPRDLLGDRYNPDIVKRSLEAARSLTGLHVEDLPDRAALERQLDNAEIVVTAGPAGVQLLTRDSWASRPSIKLLLDYNLSEPRGIEGVKAADDLVERDGKVTLGPLAIGNSKMKVHAVCLGRLFERNDLVLDTAGIFAVAKEIV